MTSRWIVSIAQIREFQQTNPAYLTSAHCAVYDTAGNETIIKGYRLDDMLGQGFLEEPPRKDDGTPKSTVTEVPEEIVAMPEPVGVQSARLQPRRRPRIVGAEAEA